MIYIKKLSDHYLHYSQKIGLSWVTFVYHHLKPKLLNGSVCNSLFKLCWLFLTRLPKPVHVSKHLFNWLAITYLDVTQHGILFSYCCDISIYFSLRLWCFCSMALHERGLQAWRDHGCKTITVGKAISVYKFRQSYAEMNSNPPRHIIRCPAVVWTRLQGSSKWNLPVNNCWQDRWETIWRRTKVSIHLEV